MEFAGFKSTTPLCTRDKQNLQGQILSGQGGTGKSYFVGVVFTM
ncbi:hypothetical protein SAMN06295960_2298 [Paenibacillus aquistagni]|uniref:Uncharacterized protein n=1 Tax=Paenibacillus aquistagni TaxID=1852522 RepID=A0A1X7KD36_9BACL|nr:hypothetical protein SAMN06295960_2298 [Paenibacillus aquistagni]